MADQGIWFKLHCSALDDPDLDNLPLADFGAWSKLGAYIKRHGTEGRLKITPPARALCSMFQVPDFTALMVTIHRLPHVQIRRVGEEGQSLPSPPVTDVTIQSVPYSVSYDNWLKYQGDFSSHRVRKFREKQRGEMLQMKRAKRR